MTERLELAFFADSPAEAVALAKEWAHVEPGLRLRTIAKVRRDPANACRWIVDLAVEYLPTPRSAAESVPLARPSSGAPDLPGGGAPASPGPSIVPRAGRGQPEDRP